MEVFVELLAQACCEFMAAGGVDLLTGLVAWKSYDVKVKARRQGQPPPTQFWGNLFKVLLPLAIVLTAAVAFSVIMRTRPN